MGMSAAPDLLPVFVHGMWRTGSTYFWNKFRNLPRTRAFLEPLHECLFDLPEQQLRESLPLGVTTILRHPEVDRFYYDEYEFRPEGGVPHFQKHFPYQRYCLDPSAADPELERYVLTLLELAWKNKQQPVLQFNRGLLRAGWLAKHFEALTIVLLRHPFDTWSSFLSYDNLYFPAGVAIIIGQNPELWPIAEAYNIPCFIADSIWEEMARYGEFVAPRLADLYPAFFELTVLANTHAVNHADIVIDVNQIAVDPAARSFVTRDLKARGIDLSFDDCAIPVYASAKPEALCLHSPRPKLDPARLAAFKPGLSSYWRSIFEGFCW